MFKSAGVLMLAVAGAFATSASKNADARVGIVPGYIKQGPTCVLKNEDCQDTDSGTLCTETQSGGAQVFKMTGANQCSTVPLWRPPH